MPCSGSVLHRKETALNRTKTRIPRHLRQFVVEQDYKQYDEVAQAVWRFVLLQTHATLRHTAHPSYVRGLEATGMSVQRIPRVEQMDECLSKLGWGAVCVDGFIPPRAFQAFQGLGILPIAAEIRSAKHVAYTPAPDIIHEAAGHAPILVDPEYATYLKRIGQVGKKAFTLRHDRVVYDAIYELSELKENPNVSADTVRRAEQTLKTATASATQTSEATRLSRLYWWTAEYGLIGTPQNYRLYGAGLLSSLGESYSCHSPDVKKLPLSLDCLTQTYDITREQPQLYVAKSFDQLHRVLDEAEKTLAYARGGAYAVQSAEHSRELATLRIDKAWAVTGEIERVIWQDNEPILVVLSGRVGIFEAGNLVHIKPGGHFGLPVGKLRGAGFKERTIELRRRLGQRQSLVFDSGLRLEGIVTELEGTAGVSLADARIYLKDECLVSDPGPWPLLEAEHIETAYAGAENEDFFEETSFPERKVPAPRRPGPRDEELNQLYERAVGAWQHMPRRAAIDTLTAIHRALSERFPEEWLLRWMLLESLLKCDVQAPLVSTLTEELEKLELLYEKKQPIKTGLTYLRQTQGKAE